MRLNDDATCLTHFARYSSLVRGLTVNQEAGGSNPSLAANLYQEGSSKAMELVWVVIKSLGCVKGFVVFVCEQLVGRRFESVVGMVLGRFKSA